MKHRKKFVKQLMARGVDRNHAHAIAEIFRRNNVKYSTAILMLDAEGYLGGGGDE